MIRSELALAAMSGGDETNERFGKP